ncbi:DNA polymerase III subunit delta [Namhaeicola litoreus]|uniref:DNA polymerase III subunit delta n=1 Tax=Namhaeicola litoreus TaxID=1052145 RepID=A0ABW3Y4R8_9FLAO
MNRVKQIQEDISKGHVQPIYFLMGEEAYYIDRITAIIENDVLKEEEKGFNQLVLYGRDVSVDDIISNAKRYPMMAERQVVIVKEAQHLSRTIEDLCAYAENPQMSTVLVICYKYKTLDKRKKLAKVIGKHGVLFESKKLYENQVPDWIDYVLNEKGYTIQVKAAQMLVEFLGTDLGKISNELEKLMLIVPAQTQINATHIEENIGISKDFNNFELKSAIIERNVFKANQIIQYFSQNPKSNPIIMTISLLNSFFTQLLMYHGLKDKGRINASKALGVSPYALKDIERAAKTYPMRKVAQVISHLREADLQSKGVNAGQSTHGDILKQLLFKILH